MGSFHSSPWLVVVTLLWYTEPLSLQALNGQLCTKSFPMERRLIECWLAPSSPLCVWYWAGFGAPRHPGPMHSKALWQTKSLQAQYWRLTYNVKLTSGSQLLKKERLFSSLSMLLYWYSRLGRFNNWTHLFLCAKDLLDAWPVFMFPDSLGCPLPECCGYK